MASSSSHTSSRTWVSENTRELERWQSKILLLRYFLGHKAASALVPWCWSDWLAHRAAVSAANLAKAKTEFDRALLRQQLRKKGIARPSPAFGGKVPKGNRSSVLAQETVWCLDWQVPERAGAEIWPSRREQQYEGDERAEKQFGRVLPLLRARDPHDSGQSIEYSRHLTRVHQYTFDNVDPLDRLMRDWPFWQEASLLRQPAVEIDEESAKPLLPIGLLIELNCSSA